jgi:hypothetical protein
LIEIAKIVPHISVHWTSTSVGLQADSEAQAEARAREAKERQRTLRETIEQLEKQLEIENEVRHHSVVAVVGFLVNFSIGRSIKPKQGSGAHG